VGILCLQMGLFCQVDDGSAVAHDLGDLGQRLAQTRGRSRRHR
jgi:hypothetical protein